MHSVDNKSAKFIAESLEFKRIKHLDIKWHYIRQVISEKLIKLRHVKTADQLADSLTKALLKATFLNLIKQVN